MKNLHIDVLCNDGSPLGVGLVDVYGEGSRIGVGGAELALLTMCEAWTKVGHEIRLYNNPISAGMSPFKQLPIQLFRADDERDILIIFRSPNTKVDGARGKKIWWSCDQYTVGSFADFANKVDKIVTISEFHATYFKDTYGITDTVSIDLPVRTDDYVHNMTKIPHRMLFCSVPDRGLHLLANMYPKIKEAIPDVSLTITSDYRLWGVQHPGNELYISRFLGMEGVKFLGAIPRRDLVREQLDAQIQAYPCTYEELFCYAVAECQIAGAYPITSQVGALKTTNMGLQVPGEVGSRDFINTFSDKVIETLLDKNLDEKTWEICRMANERFNIRNILSQWDEVLNG